MARWRETWARWNQRQYRFRWDRLPLRLLGMALSIGAMILIAGGEEIPGIAAGILGVAIGIYLRRTGTPG